MDNTINPPETAEYWKEKHTISGRANAELRDDLQAAFKALGEERMNVSALLRRAEQAEFLARALAKAVERLSEL